MQKILLQRKENQGERERDTKKSDREKREKQKISSEIYYEQKYDYICYHYAKQLINVLLLYIKKCRASTKT